MIDLCRRDRPHLAAPLSKREPSRPTEDSPAGSPDRASSEYSAQLLLTVDPLETGKPQPTQSKVEYHHGQAMNTERLTIAVLTYRRPHDLRALLPMLVDQATVIDHTRYRPGILVVDNDHVASARRIVEAAAESAGPDVEIRYEHEPVPGISAGRNRALVASSDDDLLAFIDDDERPTEQWLVRLLETRERYSSDVVQGPVVSEFEVEPDSWTTAGRFFQRRRLTTGTVLDVAVTNNLLLDLRVVRRLELLFDMDLGTTGGEDTLFTRRLHQAGVPMVWCAEAFVVDVVPANRSSRRWVRQRAISTGNSSALVTLKLAPGPADRALARATLASKGVARVLVGTGRAGAGKVLGLTTQSARGTRTLMRGWGMTLGACGFAYHEYGRSHGRIDRAPRP